MLDWKRSDRYYDGNLYAESGGFYYIIQQPIHSGYGEHSLRGPDGWIPFNGYMLLNEAKRAAEEDLKAITSGDF